MRSSVNVTIEFMPQEAPMFTQSEITVRVPENTALGAQIAQLEAVSADASRIFYTIEQGDRDQQFDINFLTGKSFGFLLKPIIVDGKAQLQCLTNL